jgi:hypothetical protein
MLIPRNIRDTLAVDRQLDKEIGPEVRRPLHNETRAFAATARLRFTARDKDCANQR